MPPEHASRGRRAGAVVVLTTARRAARSGLPWGVVFGLYVVASASGYAASFPTATSRIKLATSFGANAGLAAMLGPAHRLDTVAGFTAWRTLGVLTVVGAIWGILIATRLLRGEEDAGRWEIFLAGQTTRRWAAAQAAAGLGVGLVSLWAVTAVLAVADGRAPKVHFPVTASLFLATCLVAGAALFMAVGLVVGQLAATRRQANGIAAAVLGLSYLLRMAADSNADLRWLRRVSPLGWVEELRPLVSPRPLALVPIVTLVVVLVAAAIALAGARDLGASALPAPEAPPARTALLTGPAGLAVRLSRPVVIAWAGSLAVFGLVLGLVAQSASDAISGSATVARIIGRLGGRHGGASAYLGVSFLIAAALVCFAAAGQIASTRAEEADGHLDNLLARPVARPRWLAGRLAVGAVLVLVTSVAAGLAGWAGAASQHTGVNVGRLVEAGLNVAPPALFVLGVGCLVYGVAPRLAVTATYALVSWSFLVQLVASGIRMNHWVRDTSVLIHTAPAPAASPDLRAAAWLVTLGVLAAVAGTVGFRRRDLAGP